MESDQPELNTPEDIFRTDLQFRRGHEPVAVPLEESDTEHEISIEHNKPQAGIYDEPNNLETSQPPVDYEEVEPPYPFDLQPGHNLESSAWHTIEVDETGHAVQEPSFEYGKEFRREQEPEAAPEGDEEAAVGQLAVGTSGSVNFPSQEKGFEQRYPMSRLSDLPQHLASALRKTVQTLSTSPSLFVDVVLWAIVLALFIAIIIELTS